MEFKNRRELLVGKLPDKSIVLLPGATLKTRNHDVEYPFHQESSFFYLTGFNEPNSVAALCKKPEGLSDTLFVEPKIKEQEIWTGKRLGAEQAKKKLNFQQAFSVDEQNAEIPKMLLGMKHIYLPTDDLDFYQKVQGWLKKADELAIKQSRENQPIGAQPRIPNHFDNITPKILSMRAIKSNDEIAKIEKACEISGKAHIALMRHCEPKMSEGDLEALFASETRKAGAKALAYGTIAGAGKHACTLHYETNSGRLKEHQCVLVDAGCEWKGYASDITRTFPVGGRFSQEQKELYEIVLKAQKAGIQACVEGNTFHDVHSQVLRPLVEGLVELGLLKGSVEDLIQEQAYNRFYPHSFGHWVGLDVHDPSQYHTTKGWMTLEPNMVLTVEPGLYIQPDDKSVDKKWRGIGIRIEDVVQVTTKEPKVLSPHAPKEIQDIERVMKDASELRALKQKNNWLVLKEHRHSKAQNLKEASTVSPKSRVRPT